MSIKHAMDDRKCLQITVKGPPAPHNSSIPTISDEELKSGKDGIVLVPFHSNPPPRDMSWYIMEVGNISMNGSMDRFTSLGFVEYVSLNITKTDTLIHLCSMERIMDTVEQSLGKATSLWRDFSLRI